MSTVLNRFVYQKAGWVLHMLRAAMGTEKFWTGIREYYRRYRNLNASTDDFRQVMEQAAGTDLSWFFDQWLRRPGMPRLKGSWRYDPAARQIQIELAQAQTGAGVSTAPRDRDHRAEETRCASSESSCRRQPGSSRFRPTPSRRRSCWTRIRGC